MHERFLEVEGEQVFLRHNALQPGRRSVVFVHGLGESGLSFIEAFTYLKELDANLVVPDCPGYGRSAAATDGDYSFAAQIRRLRAVAGRLGLERVVLVGHSLGGMLATLWAAQAEARIEGLMNIEGNLTPQDATFSRLGAEAFAAMDGDMSRWRAWFFGEFIEEHVLTKHRLWLSGRRYYASLWYARPEAFLANAQELLAHTSIAPGAMESPMAALYAGLRVPRLYVWGRQSLAPETQDFLDRRSLAQSIFDTGHWPMVDAPEHFYLTLTGMMA